VFSINVGSFLAYASCRLRSWLLGDCFSHFNTIPECDSLTEWRTADKILLCERSVASSYWPANVWSMLAARATAKRLDICATNLSVRLWYDDDSWMSMMDANATWCRRFMSRGDTCRMMTNCSGSMPAGNHSSRRTYSFRPLLTAFSQSQISRSPLYVTDRGTHWYLRRDLMLRFGILLGCDCDRAQKIDIVWIRPRLAYFSRSVDNIRPKAKPKYVHTFSKTSKCDASLTKCFSLRGNFVPRPATHWNMM